MPHKLSLMCIQNEEWNGARKKGHGKKGTRKIGTEKWAQLKN